MSYFFDCFPSCEVGNSIRKSLVTSCRTEMRDQLKPSPCLTCISHFCQLLPFGEECATLKLKVSNAHCRVPGLTCDATQLRHHPGNIHASDVLGRQSCKGFSLSPQDAKFHVTGSQEHAFASRVHSIQKRSCSSMAAFRTE